MNNSSTDRKQLEQFLGEQVQFEGLVVNTKCPSPSQRFICLRRLSVGKHSDSVRCHHLWLDVSGITDLKFRLASWITGTAYVTHYQRRDGSESYGITEPSHLAVA